MKASVPLGIYQEATDLLRRAQTLTRHSKIGVTEALWTPKLQKKGKPIAILLATDIHYGSIKCDYDLLDSHLSIVEHTPNFYIVSNGDDVDAFNVVGKWATGTYENPLPPQLQTLAFMERLKKLDKKGKLGCMSFGNHNEAMGISGYEWLETFARDLKCPIFTSGGSLTIKLGRVEYKLALNHKFWGTSKLNPGNAVRRFIQFEHPSADIGFLGHTHQTNLEQTQIAGREVILVIGGTYKLDVDEYARRAGYGAKAGNPGLCVILWPDSKQMMAVKGVELAQAIITHLS